METKVLSILSENRHDCSVQKVIPNQKQMTSKVWKHVTTNPTSDINHETYNKPT